MTNEGRNRLWEAAWFLVGIALGALLMAVWR
jgi:hypothetical protein